VPKKKISLIFALLFSFFLVTFSLAATPAPTPDAATIKQATEEFMAKICSGHGGVNCSIVNSDASIVCNDGTIDTSLLAIYAVPQCQKALETSATQQSDFMAKSGCFPPSELRCINEQSYQNLLKHFSGLNIAGSELGKSDLTQCRQQIADYNKDLKNYKQCLVNHGQPNFELSGKVILPILKAMFCPQFYGKNASYNPDADLCLCDKGYFSDNGQCIQANRICQEKYGPRASSKNGSCILPTPTPNSRSLAPRIGSGSPSPTISPANILPKNNPIPSRTILPTPNQEGDNQNEIQNTPTTFQQGTVETSDSIPKEPRPNFMQNIFNSFISGIKKMLNLF